MSSEIERISGEENQDLLTEIRHLKSTISALRDTLDKSHNEKETEVAAAVREANQELAQFRGTVQTLRAQMEALLLETTSVSLLD